MSDLEKRSRAELDELARELGLDTDQLPNKQAVIDAITAADHIDETLGRPAGPTVTFVTAEGVNSITTGGDPLVELSSGEPLTTSDPYVIARLREHPFVEEVTE